MKRVALVFALAVLCPGLIHSAGAELASVDHLAWAETRAEASPAPPGSGHTGPLAAGPVSAQDPQEPPSRALKPAETDKLRIGIRFMAGWGHDASQESLGLENQGRVGYAIVDLSGRLSTRVSYRFEFNPVHETQPLPSCGEPRYFYPNTPQAFGPNVQCDNDGRLRVDDYRFLALDTINQQGPVRQAWLQYSTGTTGVRFGRFILPIGFGVEEAGSFTAKDATHIQRINAEANFGAMLTITRARAGRPLVTAHVAAFIGDGNRVHDYDYYYSLDSSLDTNSALTALVSASVSPTPGLDLRAAFKQGYTGSKVETLPNFYASKRNDRALVLSGQFTRTLGSLALRLFGEYAAYTWGPTDTSADMLGLPRGEVDKTGSYAGGEVVYVVRKDVRLGINATHEELSRDDALIKYLAAQRLYNVMLGDKERSTVLRVWAEFNRMVTVAAYRNSLDNPFPWVSGIVPVAGDNAYGSWGRGNDKWGILVRFALR